MPGPKILMCSPDHFAVEYDINPWMTHNKGRTNAEAVRGQWGALRQRLSAFADISLLQPEPHLPDMVFTANAGLVFEQKVFLSRFRAAERRKEEPFFEDWFAANGFEIIRTPPDLFFEGAGDALFDKERPILWAGYGFRSDAKAGAFLAERLAGVQIVPLKLVDPRFYHLDTCFCPLGGGYLLYYPAAFDAESLRAIEKNVPDRKRIAVGEEDALSFACNAVEIEGQIFVNKLSTTLQDDLRLAGFVCHTTPLSEFMKAGGAAKCLTLLVE